MNIIARLFPRRLDRRTMERNYLNDAVSLYDLERREREVDQGKFARV